MSERRIDAGGRPRPVADVPEAALAACAGPAAKAWLVALLERRPLAQAGRVPVAVLAERGPALCEAVLRALVSDAALERLVAEPAAADIAQIAGAEGAADVVAAAEALRAAKRAFAETLEFPYDAMRPFQQEMIDAVGHAVREREALLVSAPTGIGKTIAALYPAVRESLKAGKKLFFLTSKTLQQDAAVSALKMLNDGSFRVLRIRAKQKMCAHTEMICHEDFCPYAAKYSDKMEKSGLLSRITTGLSYFDPDITFEMSKSTEVCPFEVSLELIEEADVVVCDAVLGNVVIKFFEGLSTFIIRPITLTLRLTMNMVAGHMLLALCFLLVRLTRVIDEMKRLDEARKLLLSAPDRQRIEQYLKAL